MILTLLCWVVLAVTEAASGSLGPLKLYLGPIPSQEGFVAPIARYEDSYRDLREEYWGNKEFHEFFQLVTNVDEADLILEVIGRGLADSGLRTGNVVSTGPKTAVGTSVPVMKKQLFARLGVKGTSYTLDIDGAAGLRRFTYRNEAKNILRQLSEWAKANRSKVGSP